MERTDRCTMRKHRYVLFAFVVGLVSMVFSVGRWNIPAFAFIWPVCILFAFRQIRTRRVLISASVLLMLVQPVRYWGYTGGGFGADLAVGLIIGATVLVPVLLDRWLSPHLSARIGGWSVLLPPFLFTAVNVLADLVAPVPMLAYSQASNGALRQIASLIGSYGLTFLIVAFAGVILYALENKQMLKRYAIPLFGYVIVLAAAVIFGIIRGASLIGTEERHIRTALALTAAEGEYTDGTLTIPDEAENYSYLHEKALEARLRGAELLCFAEESFEIPDVRKEAYLYEASAAAKDQELWILFTLDVVDTDGDLGGKNVNQEFLISPSGEIIASYSKTQLLPGPLEADDYLRGDGQILTEELLLKNGETVRVSSVICFDANHAHYVAGMDEQTELLLIPSWCWDGCADYQADMMVFRAVENGVAVANPTIAGKTSVYDRCGNVVFRTDESKQPRSSLSVVDIPVPTNTSRTVYSRIAGVFDWLFPLGAAVMICLVFVPGRKKREMC